MKRIFLEIDEKERKRILDLHDSKKEKTIINENYGGLLRNVARSALRELEEMLLKLPSLKNSGFRNLDDILRNFERLTMSQKSEVVSTMFRNLKGQQRDSIARIIAADQNLILNVFKETEEATRRALRQTGKLTDDEIESIIRGHKINTTGSVTGQWVLNTGRSMSNKAALQVVNNTKNTLLPSLKSASGKPILLRPAQEKSLQKAIEGSTKSGVLSWKELINEFKRELKLTGALTLFFLSSAFYDWLSNQENIEDLPSKDDLVRTEAEVEQIVNNMDSSSSNNYNLGDRVLRRGLKGSDVQSLQTTLVLYGYDLGNFGPNNNGVDGKYGPKTEEAVKEFQSDAGIKVDGLFGPESLKALNNYNMDVDDTKLDTDIPDSQTVNNNTDNLA